MAAAMSESFPIPTDGARPRFRAVITTVLLVLISVVIVRDVLLRRWSGSAPPASGVTERPR